MSQQNFGFNKSEEVLDDMPKSAFYDVAEQDSPVREFVREVIGAFGAAPSDIAEIDDDADEEPDFMEYSAVGAVAGYSEPLPKRMQTNRRKPKGVTHG